MQNNIYTRLATPADAAQLANLAQQTFIDTYAHANDANSVREHVQTYFGTAQQLVEINHPHYSNILLFVDEHDDEQMIGFAQVVQKPAPACVVQDKSIALFRYYLDKAWHGKGVASILLNAAIAAAKQAQADNMWLTVWELNPRAIAYYKKMGFTQVGEADFEFAQEVQTDFVLVRTTHTLV